MNALALAAPADANPVRTRPRLFRPGRVIQVRYTDFAQIGRTGGLVTMFGPTPDEAVREILRRTVLAATDVRPKAQKLGDVALLRRMPEDAPAELNPGRVMPFAFVEGLAEAEIASSLRLLASRQG